MATGAKKDAQSRALRQISQEAPNFPAYRPLDASRNEIRLLELRPDLGYELRHASLDDKPQYAALSYYWGPAGETKSIRVNGHEVQLRAHVCQFLTSLVKQLGSLTVWLDVICIDQRDFREQSSQVSMMGRIYLQASRVFSWLGESPEIDRFLTFDESNGWEYRSLGHLPKFDDLYAGFEQAFKHPYWTRLWIIQEFALNAKLYLVSGKATAPWDHISHLEEYELISFFYGPRGVPTDVWKKFDDLRKTAMPPNANLIDLLPRFSDARCSDPLDRIYGLRALACDGSSLVVDYSKTPFDLVVDLTMINDIARERSRKLGVKAENAGSNDGLFTFGRVWYTYLLYDELKKGTHHMPEPESLVDQESDWLRLPFVSDSGSFFRVQPCYFYHSAFSDVRNDPVCIVMECSLTFGSDGHCNSAEISTQSLYITRHEIRDSERCAKTKEALCGLFRTQVCLCRGLTGVHISRRLFAALLYLVSQHSLSDELDSQSSTGYKGKDHPFGTRIPTRLRSGTKSSLRCNCHRVVDDLVPMFHEDAARLGRAN